MSPEGTREYAPETYTARPDAEGWLRDERRLIEWGEWLPPSARKGTQAPVAVPLGASTLEEISAPDAVAGPTATQIILGDYAREWIAKRVTKKGTGLHQRTRNEYLRYIDSILQPLTSMPLQSITAADVATWHGQHAQTPPLRHKAYSFMNSVFRTAIEVDELIERNPCRVQNATRKPKAKSNPDKLVRRISHDTIRQVAALVQPRDRALILMLAYCCVRSGEAYALRQRDIQLGVGAEEMPYGWLTVERGISSYDRQRHEGETKTGEKGERVIPIPPHIVGELSTHLATWAEPGPDGLVFPSTSPDMAFRTTQQTNGHAAVYRPDGTIRKKGYGWYHARQVIGMPTLHLHHFRHWGGTLWDEAGTPDGLRRAIMGHVQQGMTGTYTHPDTTRAVPYAIRVSELAGWTRPAQAAGASSPGSSVSVPRGGLSSIDSATLAAVLAVMSPEQVAQILPSLSAEQIVAVVSSQARSNLSG